MIIKKKTQQILFYNRIKKRKTILKDYHNWHLSLFFDLHENALENSSLFSTVPSTRKRSRECGSLVKLKCIEFEVATVHQVY